QDLLPSGASVLRCAASEPASFINRFAPDGFFSEDSSPQPESLNVGALLKVHLTKADNGQVRLDAAVEISELAAATRDHLRVEGCCARLLRKVKSGQTVSLPLPRGKKGEKRWVELTIREVIDEGEQPLGAATSAPRSEEAIYQGELPPIPR